MSIEKDYIIDDSFMKSDFPLYIVESEGCVYRDASINAIFLRDLRLCKARALSKRLRYNYVSRQRARDINVGVH